MTGYAAIVIIMLFGFLGYLPKTNQLRIDNSEYRVALYSMEIDFTGAYDNFPELQNIPPRDIVSHKYFIEYGKNSLIEIVDPGNEIEYLPVIINIWDYSSGELTVTYFLNHVKKYHTSLDSIPFSILESQGTTQDLCVGVTMNSWCDSVRFISNSTNKEYKVYFNDTITNLPASKLFYPDIKYLPSKIIRVGKSKSNIQNLEQVIFGKPAIDSILNLYNYIGYDQIYEEEWNYVDPQIEEIIERIKRNKD